MIEAKDLRIGNYVMLADKGLYQIDCGHDIDEIDGFPEGDTYCEPIPLTEKWLIDLGAQRIAGWDDMVFYRVTNGNLCADVQVLSDGFENDMDKLIFSVHEYQNYIYSTIGKELTLNKKP
ncbi:hypothetical protein AAU57_12035 [Nonlabens sp. YIK11]|uniref:hypothetical protein n=1 Tax=Nonlabens sp. YIK11 TaxID=1453349 RepID=UPI0006DC7F73|nr:hypothetical protein [Nonlabens sp. YIK11]KQC33977.1 hypothetical protein AAU57_12035 [Nonlabens sp. YIK11]